MSQSIPEPDKQAADPNADPAADGPVVPVEDWIPHPVSDSAVYLDRPDPQYVDDATGADKEKFEAALSEREKKLAGHKPRRSQK